MGVRGACVAGVGAGRGQARTRGTPPPCGATSVIDVHTANVCDSVNSVVLGAIRSCCSSGFVSFCIFVPLFVFMFPFVRFVGLCSSLLSPPRPSPPLSMKLENLKDCCVFVNNKNDCALRAWTCPSSDLLLPEPPSPRMWSVSRAPRPRVNVWDQTLCSGCAQVTLATKRHCRRGGVPLRSLGAPAAAGPCLGWVGCGPTGSFSRPASF